MVENFNWQSKHLGKKVIDENGKIGKFIGRCDSPTFTVEYEDGERVSAGIRSPLSQDWKLVREESLSNKQEKTFDKVINLIDEYIPSKDKSKVNGLFMEIKSNEDEFIKRLKRYVKDNYYKDDKRDLLSKIDKLTGNLFNGI